MLVSHESLTSDRSFRSSFVQEKSHLQISRTSLETLRLHSTSPN